MKITFNEKKYNLENHEDIVPRTEDTLQHRFGVGFPKDPNGTTKVGVPKKVFPFKIRIEDIGNRELISEGAKVIFKSKIRFIEDLAKKHNYKRSLDYYDVTYTIDIDKEIITYFLVANQKSFNGPVYYLNWKDCKHNNKLTIRGTFKFKKNAKKLVIKIPKIHHMTRSGKVYNSL